MRSPRLIAAVFGLAMAIVLGAMAWVSTTVLRLERAQAEAQREAALEENVRLALWRMDAAVAPLIAQESARPWDAYGSESASAANVASPQIILHFQIGPEGTVRPALAPDASKKEAAGALDAASSPDAQRLRKLDALADKRIAEQLPPVAVQPAAFPDLISTGAAQAPVELQQQAAAPQQQMSAKAQQQERNVGEFKARAQTYQQAMVQNMANVSLSGEVSVGMLKPLWIDGRLLLARRVRVGGVQYVQGAWLDWEHLRAGLLALTSDLLPAAALVPIANDTEVKPGRTLASLPARLEPGVVTGEAGRILTWSPLLASLGVAWMGVLLAGAAVAALLVSAVSLSERRAAFVSAVTHELRTPLTTLRMYAEMLAEGMVGDASKRSAYLQTMRTEADRLGHLVENVLSYSRIERGRARAHVEHLTCRELLARVQERLAERARQGGMELVLPGETPEGESLVRLDAGAAEQILFNLVDNACKYASSAEDRRIHLATGRRGSAVTIAVCDHGPGVSPEQRRRLFQPFSKSAHDAANSAPGVGLGLALSRRLAREMGGDLAWEPSAGGGACFVLALPRSA